MMTRTLHEPPVARPVRRRRVPLALAVAGAASGGILNALAFPGLGWWPLAFVGTAVLFASLVGRNLWPSLLIGLAGGFAFWGTHISWLTVYLGPVPWLALAGLESIFFAAGCVLIASTFRLADRVSTAAVWRLAAVPIVVAGLWTLREFVSSSWPYGGFSWGRLAFSQSESPLAQLVGWVGVSGLSFLIAWVCALAIQVGRDRRARGRVTRALLPAGLLLAMFAVPAFPVTQSGSVRIAAIQGDSDAGLFADYTPGEILDDHIAATEPLFGEEVDLVVWPENSSDLNPLEITESAAALDMIADRMNAPLVTGTITTDGDDVYNSMLLWEAGSGAVDQYDKIHPVPFAEYLPDREFWFPLAPDLLSLIPRDYSLGTRDNIFDIDGANGPVARAGVAICFDIVDDNLTRQMIRGGADIILAPTNNADFGRTDESVQQLAVARLRAIETGRSVVNISTVGTSAIIAPDGSTVDRLPTFEPGAMLQDVALSTTTTPASNIGQAVELTVSALGVGGLVLAAALARRSRLRA